MITAETIGIFIARVLTSWLAKLILAAIIAGGAWLAYYAEAPVQRLFLIATLGAVLFCNALLVIRVFITKGYAPRAIVDFNVDQHGQLHEVERVNVWGWRFIPSGTPGLTYAVVVCFSANLSANIYRLVDSAGNIVPSMLRNYEARYAIIEFGALAPGRYHLEFKSHGARGWERA